MRFSLRTMWILVTACGILCAVLARWYNSPSLALDGCCPVTLSQGERWEKGLRQFESVYQQCRYRFRGAAEKARFDASPGLFAPVESGRDIVLLLDEHRSARGDRRHGVWYAGRVYLFASEASLEKFSAEPDSYRAKLTRVGHR